ncbi:MAG: hypothetical protein R2684_04525 [Pyrinomonadaceae bacterium]
MQVIQSCLSDSMDIIHRWSIDSGVVHVVPKANNWPVLDEILDLEIENLEITDKTSKLEIRDKVLEGLTGLERLKAGSIRFTIVVRAESRHQEFYKPVKFERVKLRDFADYMVKESTKFKRWHLTYDPITQLVVLDL